MSTQWTKGWGFLASKANLSNMEKPFNSGSLAENLSFLRISNLAGLLYLSNVAGSPQNWSASNIKIETVGPPKDVALFVVYGEVSDVKWLVISHHDCKVSWSWIIMNPICNINRLSCVDVAGPSECPHSFLYSFFFSLLSSLPGAVCVSHSFHFGCNLQCFAALQHSEN